MDPSWTRKWPPGNSEQAGAWVADKLRGTGIPFEAAALAQVVYAYSVLPGEPVTLTVARAGTRIRITAYPSTALTSAITRAWHQSADRLAARHGEPGDERGLWGEIDLPSEGQPR